MYWLQLSGHRESECQFQTIREDYSVVIMLQQFQMLCNIDSLFVNTKSNIEPQELIPATDPDSDKVHITLKQIVRDWADEGAKERSQCYAPILNELSKHFDINKMAKNQYKIVSRKNWCDH